MICTQTAPKVAPNTGTAVRSGREIVSQGAGRVQVKCRILRKTAPKEMLYFRGLLVLGCNRCNFKNKNGKFLKNRQKGPYLKKIEFFKKTCTRCTLERIRT